MVRKLAAHRPALLLTAALLGAAAVAAPLPAQVINTCLPEDAVEWFDLPAEKRVITVVNHNAYSPPCVAIETGQTVTFQMNFAQHPLEGGLHKDGDPQKGNPIPTVTSGSDPVVVEFPEAGAWGFFCTFHQPPMAGAVFVVERPFSDGFESGDLCAWSVSTEPGCGTVASGFSAPADRR